jgi:hypothetical protein
MSSGFIGFGLAVAIILVGIGALLVLVAWGDLVSARARSERDKRQ